MLLATLVSSSAGTGSAHGGGMRLDDQILSIAQLAAVTGGTDNTYASSLAVAQHLGATWPAQPVPVLGPTGDSARRAAGR